MATGGDTIRIEVSEDVQEVLVFNNREGAIAICDPKSTLHPMTSSRVLRARGINGESASLAGVDRAAALDMTSEIPSTLIMASPGDCDRRMAIVECKFNTKIPSFKIQKHLRNAREDICNNAILDGNSGWHLEVFIHIG